jgi:hypothetical protein
MIRSILKLADFTKSVRYLAKRFELGSFIDRMNIDAMERTEYAYSLYYSAQQAKILGYDRISAIEFGVAGGSGLLLLEKYALEIEKTLDIKIEVYGFDTAEGMPSAIDYRDLPYIWEKGFFKMDFSKLSAKLKKAKLIIGNVDETIDNFLINYQPAPIAFISFDLDYYSSTLAAFRILKNDEKYFLPRVYCFFDDCVGDDWELHSEFSGELLAINEFNANNDDRKLGKIYGLRHKRAIYAPWNDELFILHLFKHPKYNILCSPKGNWQLPTI